MPAPPHVAPDELIESAWGNAVVDELARQETDHVWATNNLAARIGRAYGYSNASVSAIAANTWYDYVIFNCTLPSTATAYEILVTVGAQISSVGYNRLIVGINGVQQVAAGESTCTVASGNTSHMTHTAMINRGPGMFTVSAIGLGQSAGTIGPVWTSIVAIPIS